MYKVSQLKNGLRVVTHHMKQRESVALGFWISAGGRYEEDQIKGVAHFLEHIVFKGSAKFTCKAIKENIEGRGGTLNAFTSEEQTCYYAKIPSQFFGEVFDVLSDIVFFPKINQVDVRKEQTVILEEIKMYHDLPQYQVIDLLEGIMWPNHPLGKGLTGTIKTVSAMSSRELKSFFKTHYSPCNIVISAAGDINHEDVVNAADKKLGQLPQGRSAEYLPVSSMQEKTAIKLHHKKIEQMHLAFGIPGYDENDKRRYILSLIGVILGGNMSSRLFVEIREKRGWAYSICSGTKTMHDTGLFLIRAGVDITKIVDVLGLINRELEKLTKILVKGEELKRAKDYLLGQLQLGLEDTMDHMLWIGEDLVSRNKNKTLKDIIREFESITPKDIKRVAQEAFHPNRYNIAVVGPLNKAQEAEIQDLYDRK